ncbi:MAG: hypothetical protein QJR09_12000 [Micrococcus sp.]|nr:hypothetical protein [Micrococcus sp.]
MTTIPGWLDPHQILALHPDERPDATAANFAAIDAHHLARLASNGDQETQA